MKKTEVSDPSSAESRMALLFNQEWQPPSAPCCIPASALVRGRDAKCQTKKLTDCWTQRRAIKTRKGEYVRHVVLQLSRVHLQIDTQAREQKMCLFERRKQGHASCFPPLSKTCTVAHLGERDPSMKLNLSRVTRISLQYEGPDRQQTIRRSDLPKRDVVWSKGPVHADTKSNQMPGRPRSFYIQLPESSLKIGLVSPVKYLAHGGKDKQNVNVFSRRASRESQPVFLSLSPTVPQHQMLPEDQLIRTKELVPEHLSNAKVPASKESEQPIHVRPTIKKYGTLQARAGCQVHNREQGCSKPLRDHNKLTSEAQLKKALQPVTDTLVKNRCTNQSFQYLHNKSLE